MKPEFLKTRDALAGAGFSPADAVFEGAISVKDTKTLELLEQLEASGAAVGTLKLVYFTKQMKEATDDDLRVVEIPVGKEQEDAGESEEESTGEA
ncbi:MAG TPA: hypothetical protein VJA40_04170 [archaeon]|nr:hypothetical protein [archaeon]